MFETIKKFQELALYFSPTVMVAAAIIFASVAVLLLFTGTHNLRISAAAAALLLTIVAALSILKYPDHTSQTVWLLCTLVATMIPALLVAVFAFFLPRFTLALFTASFASIITLAAFNVENLTDQTKWQNYPYEVVEDAGQPAASARETINAISYHISYTAEHFLAAVFKGKLAIATAAISVFLVLLAFIVITKIMTCAAFAIIAVRFLTVAVAAALSLCGLRPLNYIVEHKLYYLAAFLLIVLISILIQLITVNKKKRKRTREIRT